MIVLPVTVAVERIRFRNEAPPVRELLGRRVDVGIRFAVDVDFVRHPAPARQRIRAPVRAAIQRRIDQRLERDGSELEVTAEQRRDRERRGQRRRRGPARRQQDVGRDRDVANAGALRIEDDLVPVEHRELPRDIPRPRAALEEIVTEIEFGRAVGDREVKRIDVVRIAIPRHRVVRDGRAQRADVRDRADGAVRTGDPLGIDEHRIAAVLQWDAQRRVPDLARNVGCIDGERFGDGGSRERGPATDGRDENGTHQCANLHSRASCTATVCSPRERCGRRHAAPRSPPRGVTRGSGCGRCRRSRGRRSERPPRQAARPAPR